MSAVLQIFKTLKLWQFGALAGVLLGAVAATYGGYVLLTSSGQERLAEGQQLIFARYGDVVNQVSTSGSLTFSNREVLVFGSQGTVDEVLVVEGQRVQLGQQLARLDEAAQASLAKTVVQAQLNLRSAVDALAEARDPFTPLDLAQADAKVADARLSLQHAQQTLDEVSGGPSTEDLEDEASQVVSADVARANAWGDLILARKEWGERVLTALDASDAAQEAYRSVFLKWLGAELSQEEVDLGPKGLLSSWEAGLSVLFDATQRFQEIDKGYFREGLTPDDPGTPWDEAKVSAWLSFYPGVLAPTCEDGVAPPRGACVQQELDDAWDAYQEAKDSLDTVQIQASKSLSNAELAVTRAEASLIVVQEALADLEAGADPLEVEVKEKQLVLAQEVLAKAEDDLVELQSGLDPLEVDLREVEMASAQAALDLAVERLEGAAITAPMAGIVSLVNVEAGQNVNANTPIVEIVDPAVVEVSGVVDEIDVLFVREGAQAEISMDALLGEVLRGTVSFIALAARNQQGVVSYPISIQVELPEGMEFPEGLSATANIIIREELDVLMVPLQALRGSFEEPLVWVMKDGRIEERSVVLGNSDDFWVSVRQGLAEGEQVVVESSQATTSEFGFNAFRQFGGGGGFRGGFGGGGRQDQQRGR